MIDVFKLLLPALFPSWRFFDVIAPSPRIEVSLLTGPDDLTDDWRECRPRPTRIGLRNHLAALFWNPGWNETLYLATSAERLMQNPSDHSAREIRRRVRADLLRAGRSGESAGQSASAHFRFRLVFVSRHEGRLRRDVTFVSPPYPTRDALDR